MYYLSYFSVFINGSNELSSEFRWWSAPICQAWRIIFHLKIFKKSCKFLFTFKQLLITNCRTKIGEKDFSKSWLFSINFTVIVVNFHKKLVSFEMFYWSKSIISANWANYNKYWSEVNFGILRISIGFVFNEGEFSEFRNFVSFSIELDRVWIVKLTWKCKLNSLLVLVA